jgi:hypothetical protein
MDKHEPVASGVRVFAKRESKAAVVYWYTARTEPPPGYESVLDGLVFVKSSTIKPISGIQKFDLTDVKPDYQWKDNAHPPGLMIAIALPSGHTLDSWRPQLEEAKTFQDRIAVYWYLRPSNQSDTRVSVSFALKRTRSLLNNEVERLNRAIVLSRSRPSAVHYDVALSFAGEDRKYVHRVAEALADKGVKVFYDNFEEADLWGRNLYSHLAKVYGSQARYTIIFVSKAYGKKLWTKHEREAAQAKAFTQNSEYILPVRIDNTKLPGMLKTTSYVLASKNSPSQLASLIVDKLTKSRGRPRRSPVERSSV